jgi:two-component system sensor histidine kinase PilS (NtrC family)
MPPRRRLIILLRPVIATVVLGPEIYFRKNDPFLQVFPLATVILLSYFASLIFFVILKTGKRGTVYDFSQTVSDTVIVSGLVAFTGSINSPYTPLFFLNIIESSYFLRPPGAFTITTLAAASIVSIGIVWMNRYLSPELNAFTFNIEVLRYFLKIFIFVLFFYLTTALTTYFRERFTAGTRALEAVRMTTDDILEIVDSGIITIDSNEKLKQCNPAAKQILSLGRENVLGLPFRDVFPARLQGLSEMIGGLSEASKIQRRLVIENEQGEEVPLMVTVSAMRRENVDYGGILVNIIDLREQEEVQKRLRTADRMKTALELSAGIAHEIRNPLASIQGALEVIMREIKTHEKVGRLADLVLKEAERLNNIIERFLQFVRLPKRERKHAVISHILRDVVDLVKNHPKYNKAIEIKTDFANSECTVFIDPEQIKQVFLNILLNAFSAVGKKGHISIQFHKKNGYCGVSFCDSGIGMEEGDLEKIFQPFFSRNPEGSGLGLSVAHRIIEQHQGEIKVISSKGKGSTFTVWLPLSSET